MKSKKAVFVHYESGEIVIENGIYNNIFNIETEQLERMKLKFKTEEAMVGYMDENYCFIGFL